ncbi:MAG TPA: hypothetical protein DD713_07055 [Nitrospiraceae bacterium]|nr:hypothetical protein [Nitrospiraceae bacterium]
MRNCSIKRGLQYEPIGVHYFQLTSQKQQMRIKRRKPNMPSAAHPWKKFNIRGFMKRYERQKNVAEAAA